METPLAEQSPDAVFAQEEQIVSFVKAAYPTLDLSPGTALRDLVIRIYAHLETRIQEQIDLALVSSSMLEISKSPNDVDEVQVERVLSNFNVTRGQGSTASGILRLMLSSSSSLVISTDVRFTLNGVVFRPLASYILVSEENYTGASSQRILEVSGSLYTTVIEVVAVSSGSIGNIRATTVASSISPSLTGVVSVKADSDFTGGADSEDNVALLAKVKAGVVGKVFGGRDHIKAKLMAQFPGVLDVGVAGFLDPEMSRDLVDGVHIGNRVDVYVKSSNYPSRIQEKMSAIMVSYDNVRQEGVFEVDLPASKAAGLYTIESVRSLLSQSGSFAITMDMRTLSGNTRHLVPSPLTAAFTSYQTIKFRFEVPHANIKEAAQAGALPAIEGTGAFAGDPWLANEPAPASLLNAAGLFLYYVEYLKMPSLIEIQAYVDSASERSLSADMLVKAPIPVMCSLQMRLMRPSGAEEVDMYALKAALVSKFNSFGMGQSIPASSLIHTAYQNMPTGYTVDLPVHMYGVIISPDMTKDVLYSSDALRPPKLAAKGISGNTCAFFLESNLIDISVVECP